MRVAVLWTGLSGYLNACLKELAGRQGVELFVSYQAPVQDAPFDENQYAWISNRMVWQSTAEFAQLASGLRAFRPDIVVICGWHIGAYRRVAKDLEKQCWRVMVMDNGWRATVRQMIGAAIAPWYIRPLADAVWLPGERQAEFARRLGFKQRAILWGSLSCDQLSVETVHASRLAEGRAVPRAFLFMGRFVSQKGVEELVAAYESYREKAIEPWPLFCCGAGPLVSRLRDKPGIRVEGFVQPSHLRDILALTGCLILPSKFEPWGLVVHEATSAGLLVLASENVGAAVHLVQDNYNGFIFDGRDPGELAALMSHVSSLSDARLDAMSRASHLLSKQFSPARWADTLIEGFHVFSQKSRS